ncbi:MAG: hypothetical protein Q8P48_00085, partial [Deltaproteobacteria bacterium]|nr:hypothetical protein [Deltaproteobacteria bacterium]
PGAVTFGDLNDPESRVSKLAKSSRGYALLGELDTFWEQRLTLSLRLGSFFISSIIFIASFK